AHPAKVLAPSCALRPALDRCPRCQHREQCSAPGAGQQYSRASYRLYAAGRAEECKRPTPLSALAGDQAHWATIRIHFLPLPVVGSSDKTCFTCEACPLPCARQARRGQPAPPAVSRGAPGAGTTGRTPPLTV